ncbi:MAG: FAD-dependent oxidoreductase [Verrucomicrobiota bacterium]
MGIRTTTCCIVGGGPAGVLLAYLLSSRGIKTTLLEAHKDFNREFRGDTFHASSIEVIDQLGLMPQLESLLQAKIPHLGMTTVSGRSLVMGDFSKMKSPFPFVGVVPQSEFLDMMVKEANAHKSFELEMEARAKELIEDEGAICGVRYQKEGNMHEIHADLVVGADGRASKIRRVAGLELMPGDAPPMDVVWFKIPRQPEDAQIIEGVEIRIGQGEMLVLVNRGNEWQGGLVIMKKGFSALRKGGIEGLHKTLRYLLPQAFQGREKIIENWKQVSVLSVQVGRLDRWYKKGLLLIGDAAHVMSPIGGVGINYAMQDAVATANCLFQPLLDRTLTERDLKAVQERRKVPTIVMQKIQAVIQNKIIKAALNAGQEFSMPWPMRLIGSVPGLNHLPARMLAYGLRPERVIK